jgi:hypothetical protein
MMRDTLYYEQANGRYESWTFSDGQRVFAKVSYNLNDIIRYAQKHGYKLIHVS